MVIVVTGYGTVQSAVQAMKNGAYDYVTKPFSLDELKLLLERVATHFKMKSENRLLREKVKSKQGFGGIVGRAPEMEKLYRIIAKAANSTHPVLILGESGTGKEMVARSIHYSGPFRDKPFIPVDCGSLVPTLIESELFGYVKGAFTGANQAKEGLLAMAEGGRFFLTKSANSRSICRPRCCGRFRKKRFAPSAARAEFPSTCAFWLPPIAISSRPYPGRVPPRSLFPPQRAQPAHSRATRTPPGHSFIDRAFPRTHDAHFRPGKNVERRSPQSHAGLRLAGKRSRAGKLPRTDLRLYQRPCHLCSRPAAGDSSHGHGGRRQIQRNPAEQNRAHGWTRKADNCFTRLPN